MQAAAFVILSEDGKKDTPLFPVFAMDKRSQFPAPNAGFRESHHWNSELAPGVFREVATKWADNSIMEPNI